MRSVEPVGAQSTTHTSCWPALHLVHRAQRHELFEAREYQQLLGREAVGVE